MSIDNQVVGDIGTGLVVLLGITHDDEFKDADYVVNKCINLRIFEDENNKMNRSLLDIKGEILIVSQFTLYGDTRKGRRPGFSDAAAPEHAVPLYEYFIRELTASGLKVATGVFGAEMVVSIENDGPVTLMVESP